MPQTLTVMDHLEILHRHGLTPALLERWASFCAQEKQGTFVFHHGPGGRILAYEEHHKARVCAIESRSAD